ncbi:transposase, partial [Klebsiella variicola]
ADRNRSHWSTSKTPSYTKSVSWQHHRIFKLISAIKARQKSL